MKARRWIILLLSIFAIFALTGANDNSKSGKSNQKEKSGGFLFFGGNKKQEAAKQTPNLDGSWRQSSGTTPQPRTRRSISRSRVPLAELPAWGGDPNDENRILGGALWPSDARPTPPGADFENVIIPAVPFENITDEPDFLVIPIEPFVGPPEPEPDFDVIAEEQTEQIRELLQETPSSYLIDPLQLLTEQEGHDLEHFLAYHAEAAPVDVAAMMLPSGVDLSGDVSFAELRREWFGDEPVMLVVYTLGNPGATELIWSNDAMPLEAQQAIWAACLRESLVANEPFAQSQRYLTELATRLYWYHTDEIPAAAPPLDLVASSHEGSPRPSVIIPMLGLLVMSFGSIGLVVYWIQRRRERMPMLLPEVELSPRLGGPFGGGGHAVVSFGE
ncbi:MAG: hypothetical protein AAF585_19015 [Verrucomicrobiota bacterium]